MISDIAMLTDALVAKARVRFRGPRDNAYSDCERRLVPLSKVTKGKLKALAAELSKKLGVKVFPMHVAALIVEERVDRT